MEVVKQVSTQKASECPYGFRTGDSAVKRVTDEVRLGGFAEPDRSTEAARPDRAPAGHDHSIRTWPT